jgi:hypothetical protein
LKETESKKSGKCPMDYMDGLEPEVDLNTIEAPENSKITIKDTISLWTTNILQMYGDAPSVDGAPVAEVRPYLS